MLQDLKRRAHELRKAKPGERFEQFYRQGHRRNGSAPRRPLVLGIGLVSALIGVILLFTPGPGLLFLFAGGAILAEESLTVARALDWTELRVRAVARRWRRLFRRDRRAT